MRTASLRLSAVRPASTGARASRYSLVKRALGASDLGVAERVERGASQPLSAREDRGTREGPVPERDPALHSEPAQERRVQLKANSPAPVGQRRRFGPGVGVDQEASDFVLVFVGHQLAQVAGYRERQLGRLGSDRALGICRPSDLVDELLRVRLVLVVGEDQRRGER